MQELVGIGRATYYRWKGRLKDQGLAGLKPRSRRPQRRRGKVQVERLWKGGYTLSERTLGRIPVYLAGQGRVERARRGRGKPRRRAQRPYAQRKPQGYEVKAWSRWTP